MKATTEPGAIVNTDGWGGYNGLAGLGYEHRPQNQSAAAPGEEPYLPRPHRAISNLKAWLHGTHRWASPDHLSAYLEEHARVHLFGQAEARPKSQKIHHRRSVLSTRSPFVKATIMPKHPSSPPRSRSRRGAATLRPPLGSVVIPADTVIGVIGLIGAVSRLAIGSEAPATARVPGELISSTRAMLPAGG